VYIYPAQVTGNVESSESLESLDSLLVLSCRITTIVRIVIRIFVAEISKLSEIFLAIGLQTAT